MTDSARPSPAVDTPRARQRHRTRSEILHAALEVMREEGLAGLNLTEVAKRVGLRQPSLYQYFPSRTAVYNALFQQAATAHLTAVQAAIKGSEPGWPSVTAAIGATLLWSMDQPTLAELLFAGPVPGFTPTAEAFAPSVRTYGLISDQVQAAAELGHLHPQAATDHGMALLVATHAGLAVQHFANEPTATYEQSSIAALLQPSLEMYRTYFDAGRPTDWDPWNASADANPPHAPGSGPSTAPPRVSPSLTGDDVPP